MYENATITRIYIRHKHTNEHGTINLMRSQLGGKEGL